MSFEPKILGFLCNWCSYAGADLAGVSRIQYPPNIRVIRVMCSGRVDPAFIFEGFQSGLDGIIVMGCHPGDCHYLEGNYEAEIKFNMVKKFLKLVAMDNRVRLEWVSASEGNKFAKIISEFTNSIKKLGPSPVKNKDIENEMREKLKAIELAAGAYRMRALVGRERAITQFENVYGEKIPLDQFKNLLDTSIRDEYYRYRIVLSLRKKSQSVKALAKELLIDPSEILSHILILKNRGLISMEEIIKNTPIYVSVMEG